MLKSSSYIFNPQYAGWYEDASVGGLEKSLADTLKADPNFGTLIALSHNTYHLNIKKM